MSLYADTPVRRFRQVTGDALLVLWIAGAIWLASIVHDVTLGLAVPGEKLEDSAGSLADRLRQAGDRVGDVPLVGDKVRSPFDGAGSSADQIAAAGRSQVEAVHTLAFWLALAIAALPILAAVLAYVPFRWRFYRKARAGRAFLDSGADLDLFALRAMTHQPLHALAKISDDPVRGWRSGDPEVVRRLALLELRDVGLRPPASLVER